MQPFASGRTLQQSKPKKFRTVPPPRITKHRKQLTLSYWGQAVCDSEGEAITTGEQIWQSTDSELMVNQEPENWYAVQTRARNEKVIAERLQEQGLTTFLPLVTEIRTWSDRKKKVELPLFSCYVFVKLVFGNSEARMRVYRTNGVFGIVSMRGEAIPIPEEQIEALRTVAVDHDDVASFQQRAQLSLETTRIALRPGTCTKAGGRGGPERNDLERLTLCEARCCVHQ